MSAHMELLADGLARVGEEVHVWEPQRTVLHCGTGVEIHKTLGKLGLADFWRTGKAINAFPGPRRLLVYWVPHAYRYRAMNVPFCVWIWFRSAWHKDRVELMIQECYLDFKPGMQRQNIVALVHRLMTIILLQAADHLWPALIHYEDLLRPYQLGRSIPLTWLPVPSNIAVSFNATDVAKIRSELAPAGFLVGHFGTFGTSITDLLEPMSPVLLEGTNASLVLLGSEGEKFRQKLADRHPNLSARIHASGYLSDTALSNYLSACDVLIQPYPDGMTGRRGSALAPLAHGRPIVSNIGMHTEAIWKETGSIVFAPLSGDGFLDAVRRLENDPAERERVGAAAQETYRRYFDPAHMVNAIRSQV